MSPQTETKTGAGFKAGVKDYRLTYYTPDYQVAETDILAAFRMTPQPGVPAEECGAAVAAESSTGTWTTVWTDGLTQLDKYKGRCYDLEPVPGESNQFIVLLADVAVKVVVNPKQTVLGFADTAVGAVGIEFIVTTALPSVLQQPALNALK